MLQRFHFPARGVGFVQACSALAAAVALPAAQAQSITVAPLAAVAPAAIPVDHPGALALLALALGACLVRGVRKGRISLVGLRAWAMGGAVVVTAATAVWGERVQAQIQELQEAFNQAAGETLTVPVQTTAVGADGAPQGFLPVVYRNQTSVRLKITGITDPVWNTCFPLGVPGAIPSTAPRPGSACAVGAALEAGDSCWVDVAQLCAEAADTVRGSHPSVLAPDSVQVDTAGQRTGNVLSNDSDADGALVVASFTYEGQTVAAGSSRNVAGRGTFALQADGSFTFQADANYSGGHPLAIGYTVQTGASSTLSVFVNRVPVAGNDTATTDADTSVTIAVRGNDSDADGDSLTVSGITQGTHGSVVVDAVTGNPVYTPNANFTGSDSFTYTIGDGRGGSATASVSVTVAAAPSGNQPPVSVSDAIVVAEGAVATVLASGATSVLANDTDPDGNPLVAVLVTGPAHGTLTLNANGTFSYTHNGSETTSDSFTYRASDGQAMGNIVTVSITVTPVNDAPVAVADQLMVATDIPLSISFATLLANDTDADGDSLTITLAHSPVNGSLALQAGGVLFTPAAGYEGPASFLYDVSDGRGGTSIGTVNLSVGTASAPSVVVLKSLLAIAHGTGGTSVRFPITTKLVDTDGSETLSIRISGLPTNLSFNAGMNLGGGVWQFTEADLPNLILNLPGSYTTNATYLTVQVTATEVSGGFTASTSTVVTLKASYTTVDITTTESGNHTGNSANEYITGGNGANTINAGSGNNIVFGGGGDDNLSAGSGSDVLIGGSGNDTLNAGSGTDRLIGGSGDDLLIGGDAGENFVDVFVWLLGDQGAAGTPALDRIQNFSTAAAGTNGAGGDVLDLRDLLQGESAGPPSNAAGNLANYLHFEITGGDTWVHVSHTGGFGADSHAVGAGYSASAETQQIILEGVNLQTLYSGAATDQQIITQLLNSNKLIVD
ncbi:midcut-by-XrtH protein [Delftia sp. 60]|uniref:midcut-by-XrtH protein n=1 Tax=Delftia sp. 60 TaxID=2035216 RepID=UPI000C1A530F|nr:midcut-by-XrtH protein [Delftia sp. 60]